MFGSWLASRLIKNVFILGAVLVLADFPNISHNALRSLKLKFKLKACCLARQPPIVIVTIFELLYSIFELLESITWDSQTIFSGFYKRSINAGTWKSTITSHIQDVAFDVVMTSQLNPRWRRPSRQYFSFRSSRAATALYVSKKKHYFFL